MKLSDQVITVSQAKRLKELGIKMEGQLTWLYSPYLLEHEISIQNAEALELMAASHPKSMEWKERVEKGIFSAFSVAELGIMLPDVDNNEFVWASFPDAGINEEGEDIDPPAFSVFKGPSVKHLDEEPFDNKVYPTEAQARAAFLIFCIENKKVTVAEVNYRLSTSG
jgi:hypothetical protein